MPKSHVDHLGTHVYSDEPVGRGRTSSGRVFEYDLKSPPSCGPDGSDYTPCGTRDVLIDFVPAANFDAETAAPGGKPLPPYHELREILARKAAAKAAAAAAAAEKTAAAQ